VTAYEAPGSLQEASKGFSEFLRSNSYPGQILWVGEADVLWNRRQLWVRPSQRTSNAACEIYDAGIKRGIGVSLYAFSSIEGMAIATVLVPADEDAGQRSFMVRNSLKMTVATSRLPARRVENGLAWLALSLQHGRSSRLFRLEHLTCT
jgi:hypothetical protein